MLCVYVYLMYGKKETKYHVIPLLRPATDPLIHKNKQIPDEYIWNQKNLKKS